MDVHDALDRVGVELSITRLASSRCWRAVAHAVSFEQPARLVEPGAGDPISKNRWCIS
jgi:hypothetical protein